MNEFFQVLGRTPPVQLSNQEFKMLANAFLTGAENATRAVTHNDLLLAVGVNPHRGGMFHGQNIRYGESIIERLLVTRLLVEIPGGGFYRLTDIGLETLRAYFDARSRFQKMPLIRVGSELRSEQTFPGGHRFQACSFIQQLLDRADRRLDLLDPYLKAVTVYQLGSVSANVALRLIVTSKAGWGKSARRDTIEALRTLADERPMDVVARQHPSAHSRWLLLDAREVWESSQTLGDLGRETGTISQHREPQVAILEFERYWAEATAIEGVPSSLDAEKP